MAGGTSIKGKEIRVSSFGREAKKERGAIGERRKRGCRAGKREREKRVERRERSERKRGREKKGEEGKKKSVAEWEEEESRERPQGEQKRESHGGGKPKRREGREIAAEEHRVTTESKIETVRIFRALHPSQVRSFSSFGVCFLPNEYSCVCVCKFGS